jgi:hypothetical protein
MKIEQAFNYKIVRVQCEDVSLYKNEDLTKAVNHVLNMPNVKRKQVSSIKQNSQQGNGLTTVGIEYLEVANLPGATGLNKWIEQQMVKAKVLLDIDKPGTSVKFKRSWANRMFRGAKGKCHQHIKVDEYIAELTNYSYVNFRPDIVGIFYIDVPPDASKLIVINNGREYTDLSEYSEEDRHYITPTEGELILHLPEVWHAVGVHNSDLYRTCHVYDADFL